MTLSADTPRGTAVSRRAFLAGAFAVIGGGVGFAVGRGARGEPRPKASRSVPAGMPEWQRKQIERARLLAHGPIDVLFEKRGMIFVSLNRVPRDPDLWIGAHRLAEYVVWTTDLDGADRVAKQLLDFLERLEPVGETDFASLLPSLRRLGR